MQLKTKVYQRENNQHIGKLLKESIVDMFSSFFLARQFATRDIKAQYRQSYLGIIWAFIGPIATAAVWIFLNKSGTLNISDTGIPYPVYAFSGTLLWSIMTEAINSPTASTNGARNILSKINFPKEALIISGIYKLLFNSLIKIVLLLAFVLIFGVGLQATLLWLPLVLIAAIFFGTSIGLLITPLALLYKDVGSLLNFTLRFLMYATPVVYAIPKEGIMKTIMQYNPFTPFIITAREMIVGQSPTMLWYFAIVVLCCIPLFLLGLIFYRISIPIIVERSSA